MPKSRRGKTKSEAWKNLRKAHLKGPKRVALTSERRKKGVDPLFRPESSRIVEIDHHENGLLYVVVLKSVFERMGLRPGSDKTMREGKLFGAGAALRKTFTAISHNDRILGTILPLNFPNYVRRCFISPRPFGRPAQAKVSIRPSLEEEERSKKTAAYVRALFNRDYC